MQDKYGYIWFNSEKLLIRHNGSTFKVYRHEDDDSSSLPASKYYDLFSGTNGALIVGCEKGIFQV